MNKLYFRINKGKLVEFATVDEGKSFNMSIDKFITKKDLNDKNLIFEEISYITFKDDEGNTFEILPNLKEIKNEQ